MLRDIMKKKEIEDHLASYYGLLYVIFLSIITIFLSNLLIEIRYNGYISQDTIKDVPTIAEIWFILLTFCFGLFYGAVIITLLDIKKRIQGIWIILASLIFLYIYYYVILYRPEIFIFGFIIGIWISYIKGKTLSGKYKEYPAATLLISFLVLYMAWASYVDYIFEEKVEIRNAIWYLIIVILFSKIFILFNNYEVKNSRIFVIGPRQSGKSVFMCGCYDMADKLEKTIGPPSKDLEEALRNLYKGWLPGTVIPKNYIFKYLHGKLFVNEVEILMYDIGGEFYELHINEIILYIKNISKKNSSSEIFENSQKDNKRLDIPRVIESDQDVIKIGDGIYNADKLIFIIDGNRIGGDEDYISNIHTEIIRAVPNKPYYIIVTKSDKFYDFNQGLTDDGYNTLKQIILDKLKRTGNLRFIITGHYEDTIPVFFMESRGIPAKEAGEFITLGFDKILEVIN